MEKDDEISIAASAMGKKRWADSSEDQRNAAMEKARAERQRKVSKTRRREIASLAANARWAKVRSAKDAGQNQDRKGARHKAGTESGPRPPRG
jgi:hypothetical protein